ncbi:MAG: ABC transporter permease subunit [Aquiluna sp.]|nr:ABC transporter permease subunit [Aquiluna sp.]MCF8545643.1 ABC transporter permease subunit [Aquiluna sp.]
MTTSFELIANTALIATSSAVLALSFGLPIGRWLQQLPVRLRRGFGAILVLPFVLPPFLVALALSPLQSVLDIDSKFGMLWIILANAFMNIGFIARVVASTPIPRSQVEAAVLDGAGRGKVFWLIELPNRVSSLSAATLLVSLYSATSYGIVLVLGRGAVQTLETEIAELALRRMDLAAAGWLGLFQTLLTVAMFLLSRVAKASPGSVFGRTFESGVKVSGLWALPSLLVFGLVLYTAGGVLYRGFGAGIDSLGSQGFRDILNVSILEAGLNSLRNIITSLLIAVPIAWLISKRRSNWVLMLSGVSPVVFGLLALVGSGYLPRAISGSWLLLPIVQSLFLLPLLYQIIRPARLALSSGVIESAQLDGANAWQRFSLIELPLLRRPVSVAIAFAGLAGLGEFGASSLLAFGSQATLPVAIMRLISRPGAENLQLAMFAASLFILIAVYIVWLVSSEREN